MKEQPDSQWLEELLKEEEPYVDNDGFSKKVVQSLPQRRRLTWRVKRRIIKILSILVGLSASLLILNGTDVDLGFLQSVPPVALVTLGALGVFGVITVACVWITSDRA